MVTRLLPVLEEYGFQTEAIQGEFFDAAGEAIPDYEEFLVYHTEDGLCLNILFRDM